MIKQLINHIKYLQLTIFALAFLIYANTIPNDYALDDSIVITQNMYVQKGIAGINDIFGKETFTGFFKQKKNLVEGGRYRPLSLVTFAIEHSLFGNNPHISHIINALLYGFLCIILFLCLRRILEYINQKELAVPVSFIASLLFAAHPIHTEVIANIKGRDEILSLLFTLSAIIFAMRYYETKEWFQLLWAGIILFLGLLSKENAITAPVLITIVVLMGTRKNLKGNYFISLAVFAAVIMVYYSIRHKILGSQFGKLPNELMNNPYLYASTSERIATIFYTLFLYLKLLVFPHPLTFDYYPYHIKLQEWTNHLVIFSLIIYLTLILFSAFYLIKKNYKIAVLSILIYLVTIFPLSNLIINTGSFMNERFVFFGSIGFCLILAYGIYKLFIITDKGKYLQVTGIAILIALLMLYSVRTIIRNTNWKDNYTLFLHDVQISSGSAKGNVTAGGTLLEKATAETDLLKKTDYLNRSISHLEKALTIYPNYVDALLLAGNAYFQRGQDFKNAERCYSRIFETSPAYDLAFNNYKVILLSVKESELKRNGYLKIISYRPNDFEANSELGSLYGKTFNQLDSAIYYLERAVRLKPSSKDVNRDLGVAYGMKGLPAKAVIFFENTVALDPDDPANHINLGLSYQQLGRMDEANKQFQIARELQSIRK